MKRMNVQNARVTLARIKKCAVAAGIYHAWFISFGTLLGCVRPSPRILGEGVQHVRGFIEHDDDIDLGLFSDQITREQEEHYLKLLDAEGMWKARPPRTERRSDTDRLLWFTMRREEPPVGTKACHWMFYRWRGYWWHTKGLDWIQERKFPSRKWPHSQQDEAIAKGMPGELLDPGLMEVEFEGDMYNIPILAGHCVDWWYPAWAVPKVGGASCKDVIGLIGKWGDERTWKIF